MGLVQLQGCQDSCGSHPLCQEEELGRPSGLDLSWEDGAQDVDVMMVQEVPARVLLSQRPDGVFLPGVGGSGSLLNLHCPCPNHCALGGGKKRKSWILN